MKFFVKHQIALRTKFCSNGTDVNKDRFMHYALYGFLALFSQSGREKEMWETEIFLARR
jgi:hypothetical protein